MELANRTTAMRRAGALLALVAFEIGAVVVLHRLGQLPWLRIPFDDLGGWLQTSAPEDVLAAVVRLVALGAAWWLLGSTALYALARLSRIPGAIKALERVTLPSVRRLADQAIALTLATSIMSGGASAALANPAGIPTRPESVVVTHDPLSTWTRASTFGYDPAPGTADPPAYQPEAAGAATVTTGTGAEQAAGGTATTGQASPGYRPEAAGAGASQGEPGYEPKPAGKATGATPGAGGSTTSSTSEPTTSTEPPTTTSPPASSTSTTSPSTSTAPPTSSTEPPTSSTTPPTTAAPAEPKSPRYVPRAAGAAPSSTRSPTPAAPGYTPAPAGPPGRPPAPLPGTPPGRGETGLHRVVEGDSLWTIARDRLAKVSGRPAGALSEREIARYWLDVVDANRASLRSGDPDLIFPGEIIKLPPVTRHEP